MANSFDSKYFAMLAKTMKDREELRSRERRHQFEQEHEQQIVTVHTLLGSREIELLITEFNPTKNPNFYVTDFIRQIELLGNIHKWDPQQLLLYATMRLRGIAKIWYHYSLDCISDWDDFKQQLIINFPRAVDPEEVHSRLIGKKRGPEETLEEYFHTTVRLAKKIKLSDDATKDYLIRGLNNTRHQVVLSSIGRCTLIEFLQHLLRLEKDTFVMEKSLQDTITPGPSRQLTSQQTPFSYATANRPTLSATTMKYQNISDKSTNVQNPPVKKRKTILCFICKSENHLVSKCPDKPEIKTDQSNEVINEILEENVKVYDEKLAELRKQNWVVDLQMEDPFILRIRKILDGLPDKLPKPVDIANYKLVKDKVYYTTPDGLRFFLPRRCRIDVMKGYHDYMHELGYDRVLKYIQRLYWFPKMRRSLQKFLQVCFSCVIRKVKTINSQKPYYLDKIKIPFYTIYVDFYGPYPKTTGGNEHVFMVLDAYSQYIVLKAVQAPTTGIATKVLDLIAEYLPAPTILMTKNSSIFAEENFQKYCEESGIKHVPTTDVTNKITAKILNNLIEVLKTNSEDAEWDKNLPKVQETLNSTRVELFKGNPSVKLLQYSPIEALCEKLHNMIAEDRDDLKTFQEEMPIGNIEHIEDENNAENVCDTEVVYSSKETVMVRITSENSKDTPRYHGPYVIRKALEGNRYSVTDTHSTQIFNEKFVKICLSKDLKKWPTDKDLDNLTKLNVVEVIDGTEDVVKE